MQAEMTNDYASHRGSHWPFGAHGGQLDFAQWDMCSVGASIVNGAWSCRQQPPPLGGSSCLYGPAPLVSVQACGRVNAHSLARALSLASPPPLALAPFSRALGSMQRAGCARAWACGCARQRVCALARACVRTSA
eukprot:CAMPEP_0113670638 /NCGR_PEP_ID=MMETSP0038_2-20120614/5251_1 /TAXON_ID=2898 /ORGANISM="Cryptomonas paramecium" /LENGTH=134 /DNA_ID=CAMNT_0000586683 /DNA_START=366 /DNA_END=768 /DNA_ORIENTATION=- /assembly_acc=CAM_ASM_000170